MQESALTRLRFKRQQQGLSLDQLSQRTGIERSTLHRVERRVLNPSQRVKEQLEAFFGDSLDRLLMPVLIIDPCESEENL